VPTPREWSASPAWPQGRGVFLLRPLLRVRRADLRAWLAGQGERWIEDPANDDPSFARTLARRRLAGEGGEVSQTILQGAPPCAALACVIEGQAGDLTLPRAALAGAGDTDGRRLLAALCLCAAGTSRPPRGQALERLLRRLASPGEFVASLAGARIEASAEHLRFCREPGEFRRGGLESPGAPVGESVFDGRFAVIADEPGWRLRPLRGIARRLPAAQRARLRALPVAARGALPVATAPDCEPFCPIVASGGPVRAFQLAGERLLAAMGGIADEASLWRVAKRRWDA